MGIADCSSNSRALFSTLIVGCSKGIGATLATSPFAIFFFFAFFFLPLFFFFPPLFFLLPFFDFLAFFFKNRRLFFVFRYFLAWSFSSLMSLRLVLAFHCLRRKSLPGFWAGESSCGSSAWGLTAGDLRLLVPPLLFERDAEGLGDFSGLFEMLLRIRGILIFCGAWVVLGRYKDLEVAGFL